MIQAGILWLADIRGNPPPHLGITMGVYSKVQQEIPTSLLEVASPNYQMDSYDAGKAIPELHCTG